MIKQITDSQIEHASKVLQDHVVKPLTREGALESLIFCIASQATKWETSSKIIYALRKISHGDEARFTLWEDLTNKDRVNEVMREMNWRFAYNRRADASIDYFGNLEGEWWKDIPNAGVGEREEYVERIRWLNRKTFSFWNICLGGKNLLALDTHVMRKLSELGVEMNPYYFQSKPRENPGQKVRKTPLKKDYLRIENDARELFSRDPRFLTQDGRVDFSLVDSVLWWSGANRRGLQQLNLFGNGTDSWTLPYSGYNPMSK